MKALRYWLSAVLCTCTGIVFAAELLTVPQHIWDSLRLDQRSLLSERFVVNVMAGIGYGTILDAQTLNESSPGTTAGSRLGAAYGSAIYTDRAFSGSPRNWNYSATNNITASIAGALIGSLADRPAQALFRTRYTIKNGSGGVEYVDEAKPNAFRHSIGLCMALNPLRPIELDTCGMTREQFLARHNLVAMPPPPPPPPGWVPPEVVSKDSGATFSETNTPPPSQTGSVELPRATVTPGDMVSCKFGMASPVRISRSTCEGAGGSALP